MRGKQLYIAGDILELVSEELHAGMTMSQILRIQYNLPEPEMPEKKPPKPRFKYPVVQLEVGESKILPWGSFTTYLSVTKSVAGQSKKTGKTFKQCWHKEGIQIIRAT